MNVNITDNIENAMVALINSMNTVSGYNFNWDTVNQEDETIGDFPRCVINPTDYLADKEKNVDDTDGKSAQDYTNEVMFTLLIIGALSSVSTNPNFDIRSTMRHALDDLKMLFGENYTVNNSCDNIMYQGSQIEYIKRNDVQRPAQLRVFFKAIYSQDRFAPSQYASS
jgi:hypothetical protein